MKNNSPPEEELIPLLKYGTLKKIRAFINNHPSMDFHYPLVNLSTPLTTAIDRSDVTILTMLIDKVSGDLNATLTQPCSKTALMHAAFQSKNPEIIHTLIKKGADPNKVDLNGQNCLFYAVFGKQLQNIEALLNHQVSVESKDRLGRTPLMIAVYLSSVEVFDYLLHRGANFNVTDGSGLSVLHLAVLRRKRDCVISLLKRNPDLNLPTPNAKISTQQLFEELMRDMLPITAALCDDKV